MERLSSTSPIPTSSAYISSHSLEGKNTINCFVRDVILKKLEFDSSMCLCLVVTKLHQTGTTHSKLK